MARILVAMSGGVDSSVAAYLLVRQGHECIGVTMALHGAQPPSDADDARRVADRLGMQHRVVDCSAAFAGHVVRPFAQAYEAGLTPNPCVACNRAIKFGELLRQAHDLGCDRLATGHYARIEAASPGKAARLSKACDRTKDQSYFLCMLTRDQLAQAALPLGGMTKDDVRRIAAEQGFLNARKRESQDVCFIPDGDHTAFLERLHGGPYPAGDVLGTDGAVVGRHRGAVGYTIGQRKGLGVALGRPVYVCGKDMERNTVTVGDLDAIMAQGCTVGAWNWIEETPVEPIRALVRTHYRHTEQPARIVPLPTGGARVEFDEPQRAMTPGQFAVAYRGDTVLGGGAICSVG